MSIACVVTLSAKREPIWPDVCVRCGRSGPDGAYALDVKRETWIWFARTDRVFAIPACRTCEPRLRRGLAQRYGLVAVMAVVGVAAGVAYLAITPDPSRFMRRWLVQGTFLAAVLPAVIYNIFLPTSVDAHIDAEMIRYEFRSKQYAAEFERLNAT